MFFILISVNLVLYIVTGMSYFKGDMKMAIISGVIALILSLVTIIYYRNRRSNKGSGGRDGNSNLFDCDCLGADCDGPDCSL